MVVELSARNVREGGENVTVERVRCLRRIAVLAATFEAVVLIDDNNR